MATKEKLNAVKAVLEKLDFLAVKHTGEKKIAFGLGEDGPHYLPIVAIGQEHRVDEIPDEIDGIKIYPRFERDD